MKRRDEVKELKEKEKKLRDTLDFLLRKYNEAIIKQDKKQQDFLRKMIEEKNQEINEVVARRKQITRSQVLVATAVVVAAASVAGGVILGQNKETESKRIPMETSDTGAPGERKESTVQIPTENSEDKPTESRTTTSNRNQREYTNIKDAVETLLDKYNNEKRIVKVHIDPDNLTSEDVIKLFKVRVILDYEAQTGKRIGLLDNIVLRYFDSKENDYKARVLIINDDTGKYYKYLYERKDGQVVTNDFPAGLLAAFDEAIETEYIEKELEETLAERRADMALPSNAKNKKYKNEKEAKAQNERDTQDAKDRVTDRATSIANADLDLDFE